MRSRGARSDHRALADFTGIVVIEIWVSKVVVEINDRGMPKVFTTEGTLKHDPLGLPLENIETSRFERAHPKAAK